MSKRREQAFIPAALKEGLIQTMFYLKAIRGLQGDGSRADSGGGADVTFRPCRSCMSGGGVSFPSGNGSYRI